MSSVVLISDLLYQSTAIVFLDGGRVSDGLIMVSLAFQQLFLFLCSYVKSSQEILYFFRGKCGCHAQRIKTVYICKRLTLKKYATTHSIAHITIYNKHKHNHHCSYPIPLHTHPQHTHTHTHTHTQHTRTQDYRDSKILKVMRFNYKISKNVIQQKCNHSNMLF